VRSLFFALRRCVGGARAVICLPVRVRGTLYWAGAGAAAEGAAALTWFLSRRLVTVRFTSSVESVAPLESLMEHWLWPVRDVVCVCVCVGGEGGGPGVWSYFILCTLNGTCFSE
jgi:hypothetical protein